MKTHTLLASLSFIALIAAFGTGLQAETALMRHVATGLLAAAVLLALASIIWRIRTK